jgi:hypothetical protein
MWVPSPVVSLRSVSTCVLAFLTLAAVSACATEENAPPVATVAATAAKTRVPIGGPLELTYRFELTGDPIAADYAVFVHFVNADGQVLWNDDHAPAVPTTAWRKGTPVEYTRTIFLPPSVLHPGDVSIDVGLYRDSERLPLEAPRPPRDASSRAYRVVDLQLAPESENVFLIYQNGWHPDEFGAGEPARSWKWTQRTATVAFRHPKADADLLIEYAGRPDMFPDGPQQLSIVGAGGEPIASFPIDSADPVQRRVRVTSAQMGTADLAELRFEVDRTFVPAEHPGGGQDTRVLGARVYNVHIGVQ